MADRRLPRAYAIVSPSPSLAYPPRSVFPLFSFSCLCQDLARAACISIGARYQPGAAHQKGAVRATTAPCRTPEVA
jgi:hypothetical protein